MSKNDLTSALNQSIVTCLEFFCEVSFESQEKTVRGIAQLVEHRSPKPRAVGSNPTAPAIFFLQKNRISSLSHYHFIL